MRIKHLFCLVFTFICCKFATKLSTISQKNKKMTENLTALSLESYCSELTKSERRRFLLCVAMKLDVSYFSVSRKLVGKQQWKPAELSMISSIIRDGEWKG